MAKSIRRLFLLPVLLLPVFFAVAAHAQDTDIFEDDSTVIVDTSLQTAVTPPRTIRRITLLGNTRTKENIIRYYLEMDTGMVYDTGKVSAARKRLSATNVFSKVDIIRLQKPDGVQVYVICNDAFPISLYDIGGELYQQMYGEPGPWWLLWRGRIELSWDNFRGAMESLRMGVSFLQWRSVSLSWHKPFIGTPWSIGVGAGLSDNPSETSPWRNRVGYLSAGLGRKMTAKTRAYVAVTPVYNDVAMVDISTARYPMGDHIRFWEMFFTLGCATDHRNRRFDPHKGWYAATDVRTNLLAPSPEVFHHDSFEVMMLPHDAVAETTYAWQPVDVLFSRNYMQWNSELRFYRGGFFKEDRFAARIKTTLRNREGGALNRVTAGGDGTIRGYGNGAKGVRSSANNRILLSGEYRFPIWTTPDWGLEVFDPLVSWLPGGKDLLRGFVLRVDGGVFADGGYLWRDALAPRMADGYEYAYSGGAGLRIMHPSWERSGCIEVIPVYKNPYTGRPMLAGFKELGWTIYLDMYY